jgi:hypothetical protein
LERWLGAHEALLEDVPRLAHHFVARHECLLLDPSRFLGALARALGSPPIAAAVDEASARGGAGELPSPAAPAGAAGSPPTTRRRPLGLARTADGRIVIAAASQLDKLERADALYRSLLARLRPTRREALLHTYGARLERFGYSLSTLVPVSGASAGTECRPLRTSADG